MKGSCWPDYMIHVEQRPLIGGQRPGWSGTKHWSEGLAHRSLEDAGGLGAWLLSRLVPVIPKTCTPPAGCRMCDLPQGCGEWWHLDSSWKKIPALKIMIKRDLWLSFHVNYFLMLETEKRLVLDFTYTSNRVTALILCLHHGNIKYREVMWHSKGLSFVAKTVTSLLVSGILPTTANMCPQLTTGEEGSGLTPEDSPVLLQSSILVELILHTLSSCPFPFSSKMNDQLRFNTNFLKTTHTHTYTHTFPSQA